MSRAVREELAHHRTDDPVERRAEAAALCLGAGSLEVRGAGHPTGSGPCWVIATSLGAVARRLHRVLTEDVGVRPGIEVHEPGGLRTATEYRLVLPLPSPVRPPTGLLLPDVLDGERVGDDASGLQATSTSSFVYPALGVLPSTAVRRGWLRGASMASLSVSRPGRPAHLELAAPDRRAAETLRGLLEAFGAPSARAVPRASNAYRLIVKSGDQIGAVLAAVGAHHAFLVRDLRRLERGLRSVANRAANADRANLDRSARAAARLVGDVHAALATLAPEDLSHELRETALARIANPGSTLGEVGSLLDPPVGRATVHRRLRRLLSLAAAAEPSEG